MPRYKVEIEGGRSIILDPEAEGGIQEVKLGVKDHSGMLGILTVDASNPFDCARVSFEGWLGSRDDYIGEVGIEWHQHPRIDLRGEFSPGVKVRLMRARRVDKGT